MNPLADHLKKNGIRQVTFAGLLDVTQGTVSKMCRPGAIPGDDMKVRIARVTNGAVPVEAWLPALKAKSSPPPGADGTPTSTDTQAQPAIPPEAKVA